MADEIKTVETEVINHLRTFQINSLIKELEDINFKLLNLPLDSYLSNYESSTQNTKEQMLDYLKIRSERFLTKGVKVNDFSIQKVVEYILNPGVSIKKFRINAWSNRMIFEFLKNPSISNEKLLIRVYLWICLRYASFFSGKLLISNMEEGIFEELINMCSSLKDVFKLILFPNIILFDSLFDDIEHNCEFSIFFQWLIEELESNELIVESRYSLIERFIIFAVKYRRYFLERDFKKAEKYLVNMNMIEYKPLNLFYIVVVLMSFITIELEIEDKFEFIEHLRAIQEINSSNGLIILFLTFVLVKSNQFKPAIDLLDKYTKLIPYDGFGYFLKGTILLLDGKMEESIQPFKVGLKKEFFSFESQNFTSQDVKNVISTLLFLTSRDDIFFKIISKSKSLIEIRNKINSDLGEFISVKKYQKERKKSNSKPKIIICAVII